MMKQNCVHDLGSSCGNQNLAAARPDGSRDEVFLDEVEGCGIRMRRNIMHFVFRHIASATSTGTVQYSTICTCTDKEDEVAP